MNATKTKVLFIKSYAYTPNQSFDIPLGILYLSGFLKKHMDHSVSTSLVDLRLHRNNTTSVLKQAIKTFTPHIIAISTLAFENEFLSDHIPLIKKNAPESLLLIGGPYATSNYNKALTDNDIDFAIIGEGELAMYNFIQAYIEEKPLRKLKSIAFKNDFGNVVCTDKESYIDNLDDIPMPDYSLIHFPDYWKNHFQFNGILSEKKHTSIISSRACPYQCIYCHDIFGKKLRTSTPLHFFNEIRYLYDTHGIREFHIVDDVFNLDKKRMHEILHMIINSGMRLKIAFPNGVRGDILDKDDILLLKRAGAYMITFAIESGSERMQKVIRKHVDLPKILENIKYAGEIGLITRGFFMLGFPGESIDEMKLTIKTAIRSHLHMASFFIVVPYQNTELYNMAQNELHATGKEHTEFLSAYIASDSFYERATGYNVSRLQKFAYLRFYSPLRLVKLFRQTPNKRYQLTRWFSFAYQLLTNS